ncbi:MAG: peptidase M75 [Candidatus Amulumruptor caecigallinarius]|nr:peptidase M75 [Candidatus Amulumruptor caecigallinarius]MCM1396047.1 peptidase M75 [Candidatus Amulumruptor caecigallinarius]MCM1453046.1 peptidase M75 [bacterium]
MKKSYIFAAIAIAAMGSVACSSDKNDDNQTPNSTVPTPTDNAANIDYTAANAASWGNYMSQVSSLLVNDATDLNKAWSVSYNGGAPFAAQYRDHNGSAYGSALSSIQEMIEGCITIANEVGVAKIGEPVDKYQNGDITGALYAVESWYSWHSREDYSNNILSIRNSYYGSLDGTVNSNSLSALVAANNAALDANVKNAINAAYTAILNIPQPLRNNINSAESHAAMDACADLEEVLDNQLKPAMVSFSEAQLQPVVEQYVNGVVLPTYSMLETRVRALDTAVKAFKAAPSDQGFINACNAWLSAREPWEKSEAFLFGPVDELGLDPNMDSWPLDQAQIVNILNSGNYDNLTWGDGDEDDAIEAVQAVRGFHTLEFLLFKDGQPRKVQN